MNWTLQNLVDYTVDSINQLTQDLEHHRQKGDDVSALEKDKYMLEQLLLIAQDRLPRQGSDTVTLEQNPRRKFFYAYNRCADVYEGPYNTIAEILEEVRSDSEPGAQTVYISESVPLDLSEAFSGISLEETMYDHIEDQYGELCEYFDLEKSKQNSLAKAVTDAIKNWQEEEKVWIYAINIDEAVEYNI